MLRDELQYFITHQDELVRKYKDKYIVIKDQTVIGVYDSEREAYDATTNQHPLGSFLIHKCTPGQVPVVPHEAISEDGLSKFAYGARVISRHGTLGTIAQRLTSHPPYQYLVVTFGGNSRIFFHEDLRLVADTEQPPIADESWNDVERRKDQRRQRERRSGAQTRAEDLTSDRRVSDRRQAERRRSVVH